MWEKLKSYFTSPAPVEEVPQAQDFVFPVLIPEGNPQPSRNWRTNMWVMHAGKVGILFAFKDDGAIFHEVNRDNGETVAEYFVSLDALKQAGYYEVPSCRMSVDKETARKLGYGS
jgi:hypothetical protein